MYPVLRFYVPKVCTDNIQGLARASKPNPLIMKAPRGLFRGAFVIRSGQGGIRTLGTLLTYTRFPIVLIRPL